LVEPFAYTSSADDNNLQVNSLDSLNATVRRLKLQNLGEDYTIEADMKLADSSKSAGIFAHYGASNDFPLFFLKVGSKPLLKHIGASGVETDFSGVCKQPDIKVEQDVWYNLKMKVSGRNIECYFDDALIYQVEDKTASTAQLSGSCGIRVDKSGKAVYDNIKVTAADGTILYQEDFSAPSPDLSKWERMLGADNLPVNDAANKPYLTVKPSSLSQTSVKLLTNGSIPNNNYTMEARVRFENKTVGQSSSGIFAHYKAFNAFHLFFLKEKSASLKRLSDTGNSVTLGEQALEALAPNKWYRMKLTVKDNKVQCYLNDVLIFDAADSNATEEMLSGGCGLRTYKDYTCYDDIKVYNSNDPDEIYYENDFDGKTITNVAEDFEEKSDIDKSTGADISTMELKNELRAENPDGDLGLTNSDKYLYLNATMGDTTAHVKNGLEWADYTAAADISFTNDDETTSVALLARYTNSDNHYRFALTSKGGQKAVLSKVVNGIATELNAVDFVYEYKKFYRLEIKLEGDNITCLADGSKLIETTDASISKGTAGITASTTTAKADNVRVAGSDGSALFEDDFNGDLTGWNTVGDIIISYDGDPAQAPEEVKPNLGDLYTIDARVEGNISPMYGLGDHGAVSNTGSSVRETSNVFGVNRTNAGDFTNRDGGPVRFISNFAISPQRGFAQVLFEEADKRVVINEEHTLLGMLETEKITTLYYFFGDMKQIYKDYRNVRNQHGYIDTKPHYEMFGLGWEAFGALGWNAYQSSVMETVQDYIDEGYDITWAVIGSGFWKGDRSGLEGTTTSFGIWDDEKDPNGRKDGLPNPRFPNPDGIKTFFNDLGVKLLLGLRVHLKLPEELDGKQAPSVDGTFVDELIDKGYYLKNRDGSMMKIAAKYPTGNISRGMTAYVDGANPEAAEWYRQQAALWGVDGYKEDTMVLNGQRTYHDGNFNRLLSHIIETDDNVMIMRNGAYSLSGDILRINDANFGTSNNGFNSSPDRMPINLLAYAASGVSNVYPDIVGGTGGNINDPTFQKYLVRNAQFAALNPSLSLGINALKMNNEDYKNAAFNAINWHSTYAPYIYDAALKSWETGYPYSFTPLYIAYPDDAYTHTMINTTEREYEWLLGESLLAAPLFGTDFNKTDTRDVYLPEGTWIEYSTGKTYVVEESGLLLKDRYHPIDEIPAFVGGKGVLVGEDMADKGHYFVEVFPIANNGSVYEYTHIDSTSKSIITNSNIGWSPASLKVTDTTTGQTVPFTYNGVNRSIKFDYIAGHNYELTGGEGSGAVVSATLTLNQGASSTLAANGTSAVSVTQALCDNEQPADLKKATIAYTSSDAGVVSVNKYGNVIAVAPGKAQITASVTLNDNLGSPHTVTSNAVTFEVLPTTVAITAPISIDISDDFESGNLDAWDNLAPEGSYNFEETADGNHLLAYDGNAARGSLMQGDLSWQDYTIQTDILLPAPVSGKTVGFNLRYNEYNSCYLVGYTHGKGLRILKRAEGGVEADISESFTMEPGQTYRLKAIAKGNTITLFVDGVQKLTYTDEGIKTLAWTNGSAGLYASGMQAKFDNVYIHSTIDTLPVTFTGTSFGAATVRLSVGDLTANVTPAADGSWTYTAKTLNKGELTAKAEALDSLGKVLATAAYRIIVTAANATDPEVPPVDPPVSNSGSSGSGSPMQNSVSGRPVADQLENSEKDAVIRVNVNKDHYLPTFILDTLKQYDDKTLMLDGGWYQWQFTGGNIRSDMPGLIYLNTRIRLGSEKDADIAKLTGNVSTQTLHFEHHGTLPGKTDIRVRLEEYTGKNLFVYYYNAEKNRLELVASNISVGTDGWFTFSITHCSDFVVSTVPLTGSSVIFADSFNPETGGVSVAAELDASEKDDPSIAPHFAGAAGESIAPQPGSRPIIAVALAVLTVVVLVAIVLYKRRQNDN